MTVFVGTLGLTASNVSAQPHPTTAPSTAPAHASSAKPSAPAPAPVAAPAPGFSDRYAILSEKNIFVRNRPATRLPGERRGTTRRQEETMVLTGIALQEGRHVAFLEDSAARQTRRLVPGDQVAGGTIAGVSFDSMDFDLAGKRIHIPVGRNLLGEIAPAAPVAAADAASQPTVAGSGSSGSSRSASERSGSGRDSRESRSSRYGSGNGSSRDRNDRGNRDSRNGNGNGNGNGRESRESRYGTYTPPPPRDTLRERDPAGPPVEIDVAPVAVPGGPTPAGLPIDPNLSPEDRMKLRRAQMTGENK
jgi:hypothetical protein